MVTFVSFNINSIRLRLHQLEYIKKTLEPDIIGIQETKVQDKDFPSDELQKLGYHAVFWGQKTHYGVALLSRQPPIFVQKGFIDDNEDSQRRFIHARYELAGKSIDVLNGYFPQGESCHHASKFPLKRQYYADITTYVKKLLAQKRSVVLMGDMNVAPQDCDVGIGEKTANRWLAQGVCSFLPQERAWYQSLLQTGLVDTYRSLHGGSDDKFSWFDYRSKGFDSTPKQGLRIDHILSSLDLNNQLIAADIDYEVRAMPKPSDHAPIWAKFAWA